MSNHGITPETLLQTLPSVLANDKKMEAIAQAIASTLSLRVDEISGIEIYTNIDSLPEALLDILAVDFKVDWYNPNYPLAVKRNVIKSSFKVHKKLGTKGAVAEALSAIYPGSSVQEWFEYGGNPYYFRIIVDVTDQSVELSHDDIVNAVNIYKSLRSRLENDAIIYRSRSSIKIATASGYVVYSSRLCGTYPVAQWQGSIEGGGLEVESEAHGVSFSTRFCGTDLGSLM